MGKVILAFTEPRMGRKAIHRMRAFSTYLSLNYPTTLSEGAVLTEGYRPCTTQAQFFTTIRKRHGEFSAFHKIEDLTSLIESCSRNGRKDIIIFATKGTIRQIKDIWDVCVYTHSEESSDLDPDEAIDIRSITHAISKLEDEGIHLPLCPAMPDKLSGSFGFCLDWETKGFHFLTKQTATIL